MTPFDFGIKQPTMFAILTIIHKNIREPLKTVIQVKKGSNHHISSMPGGMSQWVAH